MYQDSNANNSNNNVYGANYYQNNNLPLNNELNYNLNLNSNRQIYDQNQFRNYTPATGDKLRMAANNIFQ